MKVIWILEFNPSLHNEESIKHKPGKKQTTKQEQKNETPNMIIQGGESNHDMLSGSCYFSVLQVYTLAFHQYTLFFLHAKAFILLKLVQTSLSEEKEQISSGCTSSQDAINKNMVSLQALKKRMLALLSCTEPLLLGTLYLKQRFKVYPRTQTWKVLHGN